jgi:hypothetical protein
VGIYRDRSLEQTTFAKSGKLDIWYSSAVSVAMTL